ncbi:MAG: hypothetical protein VX335_01810, partial [Pseudomonadota bacterium]|nr:hypothetical protein [Pseudomonadota bacterium]
MTSILLNLPALQRPKLMLYRGLAAINKIKPGAAVAIGNFDGMHIGHKKLLATLKETAKQYDTESLVILFEPHPKEYFNKQGTCSRIMSLKEKYLYLRQYGIDLVLCLRFNSQLLNTSHQIFFNSILKDQLQVQALILGSNFCFGKNRLGNIDYLKLESRLNNIDLHVIQSCVVNK